MAILSSLAASRRLAGRGSAFTLVEMLIAMAITLVMMAAVVTLFANVSGSVRNRRATIEMSSQLRHVRNVLQQDLQGATCPGLTWQRPESNHGYIEIIEGPYREGNASGLLRDRNNPTAPVTPQRPKLDHTTSILPSSNLPLPPGWVTDGAGLGDYDDILMLTTRNEHEPFVGRVPHSNPQSPADTRVRPNPTQANSFSGWGYETLQSTLAEVVWFAIENPDDDNNPNNFFGEPGMRTIYRRTLLIAPWINPYRFVAANGSITDTFTDGGQTFKAQPGLVRILPDRVNQADVADAIAAIVAFQDRYDLSVRLVWDHNLGNDGRWKIVANTLGDLTKRENRFGHFGYFHGTGSPPPARFYPYPLVSVGSGYSGNSQDVAFVTDPDVDKAQQDAKATAHIVGGTALSYSIDSPNNYTDTNRRYLVRPFAYVNVRTQGVPSTAQAMLNDEGQVIRVLHGPVPLWGTRRGEDVMMTDVLAFDLRLYDPGAPLYQEGTTGTVLSPSDWGWRLAYDADVPRIDDVMADGQPTSSAFAFVGQGAYVDLGYGFDRLIPRRFFASGTSFTLPWFFAPQLRLEMAQAWYNTNSQPQFVKDGGALLDVFGNQLAPGYAVYDTWSFHYENNGVDENGNGVIDEGTNGLEDEGRYVELTGPQAGQILLGTRYGPDDIGERETTIPYDKPLRGVQVLIRTYERDSRAIRQVRVNQHFMPE